MFLRKLSWLSVHFYQKVPFSEDRSSKKIVPLILVVEFAWRVAFQFRSLKEKVKVLGDLIELSNLIMLIE